jgi:hypothetical protein
MEGSYPERELLMLLAELNGLHKTFMTEHSAGIERMVPSRKVMKTILGSLGDVESDLE